MNFEDVQGYTHYNQSSLQTRINALKAFDLDKNMTQEDGLSFKRRLMAQCCDEIGTPITDEMATIIIDHFHEFMTAMASAYYSDNICIYEIKGVTG